MKRRLDFQVYLAVFFSFLFGFFNIVHVLPPFFKIPKGTVYLAIGHYGYDYLYYLAVIKQGLAGHWQIVNQLTSERLLGFWVVYWPYLLAGQFSRLFSLWPQLTYWLTVFFLTMAILLVTYFLIRLVCGKRKTLIFPVFLSFIFTTPFFRIESWWPFKAEIYHLTWYSNAVFFDRLSVISHHLLAIFFTIFLFIVCFHFWDLFFRKARDLDFRRIWVYFLLILFLFLLVMSLIPIRIVYLFPAFILSFAYGFFRHRVKDKQRWAMALTMLIFLTLTLSFFGIYFKANINQVYFPEVALWEKSQVEFPAPSRFLLGSGPIFILGLLGLLLLLIKKKELPPVLVFGLLTSFLSYFLFYTRVSLYFGNHNSRFIFSEAYLFLNLAFFFALDEFVGKNKTKLVWLVIIFLALFSLSPFFQLLTDRTKEMANIPPYHQYLDKEIIAGFQFIDRLTESEKIVLTAPKSDFGTVLPAFADAKVFMGRWLATINYHSKAALADAFYSGKMTAQEKRDFLYQNRIKYVIWTAYDFCEDPLSSSPDLNLSFLFANSKIKVFRVN